MSSSEKTNELYTALAKAQGAITNPAKDARNPHFNSAYANLSGGINAIRAALSANGIAYVQMTRLEGEILMLDTRLAHASDQWIQSEWPVCKMPAAPQQIGSALTYARRYSLFSIVGIAGDDDDDGDAAKGVETPAPKRVAPPKRPFDAVPDKQIRDEPLMSDLLTEAQGILKAQALKGTAALAEAWLKVAPDLRPGLKHYLDETLKPIAAAQSDIQSAKSA